MNSTAEIRVVEASLCYDSAGAAPEGARGLGGPPRMLLYRWDDITVDLLLWDRLAQLCAVHGRVTEYPSGRPVVGAEAHAGTTHVPTDEHGQFAVVLDEDWVPRRISVRAKGLEVVCAIPERKPNREASAG